MANMIQKIQKNLSRNMILYTLIVIALGVLLGHRLNLKYLTRLIIPVVFVMIYPMMVNLSFSSLKKIKGSTKPLVEALILNFVYAPIFMWFLTSVFISDPKIKLALMLLSIAPASSMGLGYLGLAEGHMLTGAIIVAFAFFASIFVYPLAGHYFALEANIQTPLTIILRNLLIILILPFVLGILTREYVERKHGEERFLKIKPYFSAVTLTSLYILIFIIFASKADLILKNYFDIVLLLPVAILFYGVTVLFTLLINKKLLSFEYGHHQAVVFTSVSKNVALTIAILVSVFGKEGQYLAVFPAIMSLFQAPFLMVYLKLSNKIRRWFEK
ncbi:MAG: arsenic resistance protein [Nanoarchaeota archaeon]|nr:arsenic resistance protein [Nanoarchaeota archaeon]